MNFGKWIVVAFILFAIFIGTLVTICIRQDISLVTKDYYKEELAYQDQIARVNNAAQLNEKPSITIRDQKYLEVTFNQFNRIDNGQLKLFRPSDASLDRVFELTSSKNHSLLFDIAGLSTGMYRAQMRWTMEGKEFYIEKMINL